MSSFGNRRLSEDRNDALIIFVKNPVAGKVKTRIAATLGDQVALDIYNQLLAYTRTITAPLNCARYIYYSECVEHGDSWGSVEKRIQSSGDLGERMENAFNDVLDEYDQVCVIGSDCVELSTEIIENAFASLQFCDAVIGPAHDGGYYLLGMSKPLELFENVLWSTPFVFQQSRKILLDNHLDFKVLDYLNDVDTAEDWATSNLKNERRPN